MSLFFAKEQYWYCTYLELVIGECEKDRDN